MALTPTQERLLTLVRITPGVSFTRLSKLLGISLTAARSEVAGLEALGLIERRNHPDHPDANELHVTAAGANAIS
jgi:DNA-binding MarR family transcriptional regulator